MVRDTLPGRGTQAPAQDRALHRRLVAGEGAALGECYDRFAPVVHGIARSVLADDRAADRTTCEVFARLWERPEAYDGRGPLRSWLTGLTHRLAVQQLRDARAGHPEHDGGMQRAGAAGPGAAGGALHPVPEGAQPERRVYEESVAARADHLVTSMPAELRSALELAYFRRLDCRQTAADLGITEDDTRRRLRLGLHVLASAHTADPLAPGRACDGTAAPCAAAVPDAPGRRHGHRPSGGPS